MAEFYRNPTTGEVVTYDEDRGAWVPAQFSGTLRGPEDVAGKEITSAPRMRNPQTGDVVEWNGKEWARVETPRPQAQAPIAEPRRQLTLGEKLNPVDLMLKTLGVVNAPFEAVGGAIGEALGEPVRAATEPYFGPTGSAIAGTAIGAPANFAVQFFGPGLALKGVKAATKIIPHLPGGQAGQIESGIAQVNSLLDKLRGAASSAVEWRKEVTGANAGEVIKLPELKKTLDSVIARESRLSLAARDPELLRSAESLREKIQPLGSMREFMKNPSLTLDDVANELSGIGENVGALASKGERVSPGYSRIFASLASDLQKTTSGQSLLAKNRAIREGKAIDQTQKIFDDLVKRKRGFGDLPDVNANQVLDKIEKNKYLKESFKPSDFEDIKAILTKLAEIPALPPPRGAMFGAGKVIAGPLIGGGIDLLAGTGGTATALGSLVSGLGLASNYLLPTTVGRKLLRSVLESGPLDATKINMLNAAARAASGEIFDLGQKGP